MLQERALLGKQLDGGGSWGMPCKGGAPREEDNENLREGRVDAVDRGHGFCTTLARGRFSMSKWLESAIMIGLGSDRTYIGWGRIAWCRSWACMWHVAMGMWHVKYSGQNLKLTSNSLFLDKRRGGREVRMQMSLSRLLDGCRATICGAALTLCETHDVTMTCT